MRTYPTSRNIALAASGSLLAALLWSGAAKAVDATEAADAAEGIDAVETTKAAVVTGTMFRYSTAQTGYLGIPNAAFTPQASSDTYERVGYYLRPTSNITACLTAPLNLPHGAKMTVLTVGYVRNNAAGESLSYSLIRQALSNNAAQVIVNKASTPSSGGAHGLLNTNIPVALQTVNNQLYAYSMNLCFKKATGVIPAPALAAARITYTYATAGD